LGDQQRAALEVHVAEVNKRAILKEQGEALHGRRKQGYVSLRLMVEATSKDET